MFLRISSQKYYLRSSTRGDIIPKSKITNTKYTALHKFLDLHLDFSHYGFLTFYIRFPVF